MRSTLLKCVFLVCFACLPAYAQNVQFQPEVDARLLTAATLNLPRRPVSRFRPQPRGSGLQKRHFHVAVSKQIDPRSDFFGLFLPLDPTRNLEDLPAEPVPFVPYIGGLKRCS
jgi:hypothetical protein